MNPDATQMKIRIVLFVLGAIVGGGLAAEPDQSGKRTQVLMLVHHTQELPEFREIIKHMIAGIRRSKPEMPFRFWEEVEREVSLEAYAQWVVGLMDRHLSEREVRELNAVFGDERKKAAYDSLPASVNGKEGDELVRAVHEFRRAHGARLANEILAFVQSEAERKYSAFRNEMMAGRGNVIVPLLVEAERRVRARSATTSSPK